jgi:hypothetical protein
MGFKYQSQFSPLYIEKTTEKIHVRCQVNVEKKLVSMILKKIMETQVPIWVESRFGFQPNR